MKRNKNLINLTESDLQHIVKESVKRVIKENAKGQAFSRLCDMMQYKDTEDLIRAICDYMPINELNDFTDFVCQDFEMCDDYGQY